MSAIGFFDVRPAAQSTLDSTTDKVSDVSDQGTFETEKTRTINASSSRHLVLVEYADAEISGDGGVEGATVDGAISIQFAARPEGQNRTIGSHTIPAATLRCATDVYQTPNISFVEEGRPGENVTARFKLRTNDAANLAGYCIRNTTIKGRQVRRYNAAFEGGLCPGVA